MWYYSQRTGILSRNGVCVGDSGYSGKGIARNRPEFEAVAYAGPIPTGRYQIGGAHMHRTKGPAVMGLTPLGHSARGRSAFLIHGDSKEHPGEASEGCIILSAGQRKTIAQSGDNQLAVTE